MEVLGRGKRDVTSISASATDPTGFASLDSSGAVTLWDMRLKKKDYMHIENECFGKGGMEAMEILLASDLHRAVVLADDGVSSYDLRRVAKLCSYKHTREPVCFLSGTHPLGEATTLIVDEDGAIMPFDLRECAITRQISGRYFGVEKVLSEPTFGSLENYCCGLGLLRSQADDQLLCALGMDGTGSLYKNPLLPPLSICLMDDALACGEGQLLNPPLPMACSFFEGYAAVGKGNGMYSIATAACDDTFFELFSAPGHALNGLSVVSWTRDGRHLVTCSVCGEVSAWAVLPLLHEEQQQQGLLDVSGEYNDNGGEGDLPQLDVACSVREVTLHHSMVNCGTVLGCDLFVVGDTMGFVTSCSIACV